MSYNPTLAERTTALASRGSAPVPCSREGCLEVARLHADYCPLHERHDEQPGALRAKRERCYPRWRGDSQPAAAVRPGRST